MEEEKKKNIIQLSMAFLTGAIIGSIITLFVFPDNCPVCEESNLESEEIVIEETTEARSSTEEDNINPQPIASESNVSLPISECSITVDIAGAVNKPGVYCFQDGSKLVDVVKKAEGFTKDVAYKYVAMKINLSELITNHQKIYIPFEEDVYCEVKSIQYIDDTQNSQQKEKADNNTPDSTQTCININTATLDELVTLNGVGESTAQKIIDARPFETIEDILNVAGIGDATFEKFKHDICV